ncbi:MAG: enoyl-CoA hydratase-related protein, partial [Pseudomonadota bacterium]
MTEPVKTRRDGHVLEITLDRPKANAVDLATSRIMGDVFQSFRDDRNLRVAILTGAGEKFFCAGWDLKAAADGDDVDGNYGVGGFGGLQELGQMNKPVISAVNRALLQPRRKIAGIENSSPITTPIARVANSTSD